MKRFSKIVSGIAAIMLGIGIILCIIGTVRQDWSEFGKAYGHTGSYQAIVEPADKLYIKIPYGYLRIGVTEVDKILFSAVSIEEGSIRAEDRDASYYISVENDDKKLELFGMQIPYQFLSPIEDIEGRLEKLGELEGLDDMEDLKDAVIPVYILLLPEKIYKEVEVSLGYGMIDMDQITADSLKLEVDAGKIRTRQTVARKSELTCDIGQIDAEGDFTELTSKVDIGSIVLVLPGTKEEYSSEASCDIGSIWYDKKSYNTGIRGNIKENGAQAGKKLKTSCEIGSIQVEFEDMD